MALLKTPQFAELAAAVVQSLPCDISIDVAQGWIENRGGLAEVLRNALCPPPSEAKAPVEVPEPSGPWILKAVAQFNIRKFFPDTGWTIWKGLANGKGLEGDEEQDERSLALSEIDLAKLLLEHHIVEGETYITGEEKLQRIKASGRIRLDARFFQALWEEKGHVTLKRLNKEYGVKFIDFPGTILRRPYGDRCVLYLRLDGRRWYWSCDWLGSEWHRGSLSALFASAEAKAEAVSP